MKYRALDSNGDYSFGKGIQDFLFDADAVAQAIKTNLLLFKAEWWENQSEGLPLFQNILGQSGTPEHLNAADLLIKERILATEGVAEVTDFKSAYENRKYTITSCTVKTTTGQNVIVSGVNL
ncbi:hypothetical protein JCM15765_04000 [Paradesulfitobacterium aromaticivorans]